MGYRLAFSVPLERSPLHLWTVVIRLAWMQLQSLTERSRVCISTQLCGRPVNPFLSHMFTYKPLTLNSIASFGHTMYKERLEGFPFMTEMDIKQMAV